MEAKHICFRYGKQPFINDLSLSFQTGKITAIVGPNGSGKSTLLMLLSRIYHPSQGEIWVAGKNCNDMKTKEFARQVAVVHQQNQVASEVNVRDLVGYGRLPYKSYYQRLDEHDEKIIDWALEITNLTMYQNVTMDTLSGGEQQRIWLAMALAQKTPILLLDEPTTYLDIKYQIEILELIRKINRTYHITVILVLHDINQAICYSDEIVAMKDGKLLFAGVGKDVITETSLLQLYDCAIKLVMHPSQPIVLNFRNETACDVDSNHNDICEASYT